jgi:DNA sulfur modification protein DndD
MLIRSLTIEDFGKYRGQQKIDLSVDWGSEKNIVLIGGLNGAGKTTLLVALRLALFGKLNDDLWHGEAYKTFVRRCLNKSSAELGKREFALGIEFETGEVHGLTTLRVERRWRISEDNEVQESLQIFVNGKEKLGLSPENAELFILERVPFGTSRFVFFDGDRIQDLLRQEAFGTVIREALESVLGLRTYQELLSDLLTHERQLVRQNTQDDGLRMVMERVDNAGQQLTRLRVEKKELQDRCEQLDSQLSVVQSERKRLSNGKLTSRENMGELLRAFQKQRDGLQQQLANLVSNDIPMLVLRPLLARLRARLEEEALVEQEQIVDVLLEKKRDTLVQALGEVASAKAVQQAWAKAFPGIQADRKLRHKHLSIEQKYAVISTIDTAETTSVSHVERLLRDLDSLDHKIRKVQQEMRLVPTDDEYLQQEKRESLILSELRELSRALGSIQVEEKLLEQELATLGRSEEAAKSKQRLQKEVQREVDGERLLIQTLREFIDRLGSSRVSEVETHLSRMFLNLSQDHQLVRVFRLDPRSFEVSLYDDSGNKYALEELSEGEKEIFVLSLIWAVSMSAVQELPMVVDTPLGRLDSVHRKHIAERFLPAANRQTIILSTDTEVDHRVYANLQPYISKAYLLEYSSTERTVTVRRGYFGNGV